MQSRPEKPIGQKPEGDPIGDIAAELLDAAVSLGDTLRDPREDHLGAKLYMRRQALDEICQKLSKMLGEKT